MGTAVNQLTAASSGRSGMRWNALGVVGLVALVAAEVYGVLTSPPDRDMGHLQKIMYVHVPAAWIAMLTFLVVAIASLRYLWKGRLTDDLLAASAVETGALLTGLTLIFGMIWAKPTWGIWWTWEPRTTSTAVLFFMFLAYLILRSFVDDPERRAQWCAVVGLLGSLNVPIVYMSVRWWRTLHQVQSTPMTLDSSYTWPLRANAIALMLLMIWAVGHRYRTAVIAHAADEIMDKLALTGGIAPHAGGTNA